jgi:hypothetical protein
MPRRSSIAVYTAITNQYNPLMNPSCITSGVDYYCFTDEVLWNRLANNTVWKIRPLPMKGLDPVRSCRAAKILPHILFPEHEYSVWVDASVNITGNIRTLLDQFSYPSMLCFNHPQRTCTYEEGKSCVDMGKDDPAIIFSQLNDYRRQGLPENAGLIESGVLIRRHNDPIVIKVMKDWWDEVKNRSRRDQLSLPYVARRNTFWPTTMGQDSVWGSSPFFTLRTLTYHGDRNVTLLDKLNKVIDVHLRWRLRG